MGMGEGSRTDCTDNAAPAAPDEQALLDQAMNQADHRLVQSLQEDELRRRRRRRWVLGGFAMTVTITGIMIGFIVAGSAVTDADAEKSAALVTEGWELIQAQQFAQAQSKFESAVKLDPRSANAWNGLGWSGFNAGNHPGAEKAFKQAVKLEKLHPAANNGLGYVYFFRRQYPRAEKHWLSVADHAPAAWFGLAKMYLLRKKYDEAAKWATKALTQQPDDKLTKRILAAANGKNLDPALRSEIEPAEPSASSDETRRGWSLFQRGMFSKAVPLFQKAIAKNPNDPQAHNGLGFCLLNTGKAAEAKGHFDTCLAHEPKHVGAMNGLARCLKAEGRVDDAIRTWEKMVRLSPGPNAGTSGLAQTHLERGDYQKAVHYFEQLAKAMPNDPSVKQGLEKARKGLAEKQ